MYRLKKTNIQEESEDFYNYAPKKVDKKRTIKEYEIVRVHH